MFKYVLLTTLLLIAVGCDKTQTPETFLRGYVNYRFSSSQDKEKILSYLTSEMYEKVNNLTDEEFGQFTDLARYSKKSFKIKLKRCEEQGLKCYLTYIVKYTKKGETGGDFVVETKKIAELVLEENEWKLSDITEVKTFIDSKDAITPPPSK